MDRVEFRPAALRELRRLRRAMAQEIFQNLERALTSLMDNLRPPGCRPISNTPYLRIRVAGVYRVIYAVDDRDRLVLVVRVARRGEATCRQLP